MSILEKTQWVAICEQKGFCFSEDRKLACEEVGRTYASRGMMMSLESVGLGILNALSLAGLKDPGLEDAEWFLDGFLEEGGYINE